jgi:hypothetical protein
MASEYIQAKFHYEFADIELLCLALKAAHRSDEEGTSDDGNRGLARIGICAVDMVETHNAIIVENGTKSRFSYPFVCWRIAQPNRGRE